MFADPVGQGEDSDERRVQGSSHAAVTLGDTGGPAVERASPGRRFMGREQLLADLLAALWSGKRGAVQAVHGMRGVGKTASGKPPSAGTTPTIARRAAMRAFHDQRHEPV